MQDLKNIRSRYLEEYSEIGAIAKFYGFIPIKPPEITKEDLKNQKTFGDAPIISEISALMRMYTSEGVAGLPQPIMLWYEKPLHGGGESRSSKKYSFSLVSIGSTRSVSECLSIQASINMLKAMGHKDVLLKLNTVGDKDSVAEFDRKASVFVRRNMNNFSAEARNNLKKNPYFYLSEIQNTEKVFEGEIPKPIDFLSEQSRSHFKEVLEFSEIVSVPYTLDPYLLGYPSWCSETVLSFVDSKSEEEFGFGVRSNRLAKKLGHKKEIPIVISTFSVKINKTLKKVKPKKDNPNFYLIQFGPEAKVKSFLVLEEIRNAGAKVIHTLAKDKLGGQMSTAQNLAIPYIILIGQKEALENSVVIRNTENRHEEKVPINKLSQYIKGLRYP